MPAAAQAQNWNADSETALKTLVDIQSMIDIMSERLVALRALRLQEFIKQEIRSLEGKLIKHFWRQLSTKSEIPKVHWSPSFQSYPSLSQLLTVVGIQNDVNEKLTDRGSSVEALLERSEREVIQILRENEADHEDERKLLAALKLIKALNKKQIDSHHNIENLFWDSWTKTTSTETQNGVDNMHNESERDHRSFSEVDYNENIRQLGQNYRKDSSDIEQFPNASNENRHEILVHTTSGRTTIPSWNDRGDLANQNPPHSPSQSSRSSLSSCGPPSPPYGARLYGFPQSQLGPGTHTPPATMHPPSYMRHFAQEHPNVQRTHSGQSSLTNTPPMSRSNKGLDPQNLSSSKTLNLNQKLLWPPVRNTRSQEWQVGSHITTTDNESMTNSNVSINTLPPPSTAGSSGTKLFSAGKKRKKRPGNIIIQSSELPDLIDLLKTGSRRPSQSTSISPESDLYQPSGDYPMSPGTPMTPVLPFNSDMWSQHKGITTAPAVPHTPKTPRKFKAGFRAIKDKIKDKIGYRSNRLRRNKSEERVTEDDMPPTPHKNRSETFPSINLSGSNIAVDQSASQRDSRHNSTHSSSSSLSSSHVLRTYNTESTTSFDAVSGMTTPGGACMLSSRDNFVDPYSEKTSTLNFTGTDKTVVTDGQDLLDIVTSTQQHTQTLDEGVDSMEEDEDSLDDELEHRRRANLMRQTSTTSTMHEEWDIPWDDLQLKECIGKGRVGSVFKGYWHGEVAIRVIEISHNDEFKLRAFKHEVMLYKMTRHENLELFMGSCMSPTRLAIVTGFCKGRSLFQKIRDQQVNLNQAKIYAQHIVQGMGYLHSKNIVHKDLKSKNIYIDGNRVVVTDFGLMGLHAISSRTMQLKPMTLQIPDGWLCYMASEVIRSLQVPNGDFDVVSNLPYTKESDVYAFGTVWYELLVGCWPFKDYPAESIIWQVGNGKKQSLAHLQGLKDFKDILMACWAFDPGHRPGFQDRTSNGIMEQLMRLPQAKMIRRSSQPVKGNRRGGRLGAFGGLDIDSLAE